MGLTCVIPDLHGRRDLLDAALARIAADDVAGRVVLLGDYVDKGPDSAGVIARLRGGILPGREVIMLKGNHDAMMVAAASDPAVRAFWLEKGGDAALASYGAQGVPDDDIAWLEALPLLHLDAHRLYVHAGVDPDVALAEQTEATLLWKRYPKGFAGGFGARHVVHGHDNDPDGPLLYAGRSNLDTLAWKTGRLVLGLFDDARPGGPVELIEILGAPAR